MECEAENAAEAVEEAMAAAAQWIADHPGAAVGAVVVIGGITFMVVTGGTGALVLVPVAAL